MSKKSPPEFDELFELARDLCEGTISAADSERLASLLIDDAEMQSRYLDYLDIHAELRWRFREGVPTEQHLNAGAQCSATFEANASPQSPHSARKSLLNWASRHPKGPAIAIAATLLIAALGVMAITPVKDWMAGGGKARPEEREPAEKQEVVAKLSNWRNDVWLEDTRPPLDDPRLKIGRRLKIESGLIEVTYLTGARVVIEGPAEFVVGRAKVEGNVKHEPGGNQASDEVAFVLPPPHNSCYLKHGRLVARVEGEKAQGFTVDTPNGQIEDLGTEFAVEVDRHGHLALGVIDGKVVVRASKSDDSRIVLAGEVARVASDHQISVASESITERFVTRLPAYGSPSIGISHGAEIAWSDATAITSTTDVQAGDDAHQTFVEAYNYGLVARDASVGGVTFVGATDKNLAVTGDSVKQFDGFVDPKIDSADLDVMLVSGAFVEQQGLGHLKLKFSGLVVGRRYWTQLLFQDARNPANEENTIQDGRNNTRVVSLNSPHYVIGTFTAVSETQTVYITRSGNAGQPQLNGYSLFTEEHPQSSGPPE